MRHRLHSFHRKALSLAGAGLAFALVACGTPPPVHVHSLMPTEITARPSAPVASGVVLRLEPIRVPALAAAHRRAVARLGGAIGQALASLRRGAGADCPALDGR